MTQSYPRKPRDLTTEALIQRLNGGGYLGLSEAERAEVKAPLAPLPEDFVPLRDGQRGFDQLIFGCPKHV